MSSSTIHLWSSLLKKTVPLKPLRPGILSWYACGPTVYDDAHIGHASSYIRQDVVRRVIEGLGGYQVLQVMGVTDIDDKIIKKSHQMGAGWETISRKYEMDFFQDLQALGVKMPQVKTRVTEYVSKIVKFVDELVKDGWAYPVQDGSVYFDTKAYARYGKLRKISLSDDASLEEGQGKKSQEDFAVWKGWKEGEPFWITPWGKGRPGWHIECSVMASHFFGQNLDIHSGGVDLIFPHHENEEAQCCARFGIDDWVTHWIHTGHLNVKGDVKMSKSLGNVITIRDFLKDHSAKTLRMFCMLSQYRYGLEFTKDALRHADSMVRKLESFLSDTQAILNSSKVVEQSSKTDLWGWLIDARDGIGEALRDDFDTPSAVQKLSDYIDVFNKNVYLPQSPVVETGPDYGLVLASRELVESFLSVTGFLHAKDESIGDSVKLESLVEELMKFRGQIRNFALATEEGDKTLRKEKMTERKPLLTSCDKVRQNLIDMGFEVKDYGQSSVAATTRSSNR